MKPQITIQQLNDFWQLYQHSAARANGQRFGQAWINEYLPANQADAEIFYEEGNDKAYALIKQKYVVW